MPPPRRQHAASTADGKLWIYGGIGNDDVLLSDMWSYDPQGNAWTQVIPSNRGPGPLANHTLNEIENRLYAWGGTRGPGQLAFDSVYAFDPATGAWDQRPTTNLPADRRQGHTATSLNGKTYVFGGKDANGPRNDLWTWDPVWDRWERVRVTGDAPAPRTEHGAFPYNGFLYVFAGNLADGTSSPELWRFDPATATWTRVTDGPEFEEVGLAMFTVLLFGPDTTSEPGVSPADSHTRPRVLVFGGKRQGQMLAETWLYVPEDDPPPPSAPESPRWRAP